MHRWKPLAILVAGWCLAPSALALDIEPYIKKNEFNDIQVSPNGEYFAATVPLEDQTALVVLSREKMSVTATFRLGKNTEVADFDWVNPERVLISTAKKFGSLAEPQLDGNLYAMNADGSKIELLMGQSVKGNGAGTHIQPKKVEQVAAFLIDELSSEDREVLVSASPFTADPFTAVDRLDVYTGRRQRVARAPIRNARFVTDHAGNVRFAFGGGTDNIHKLYYRDPNATEWEMIANESVSGVIEQPIGFSEDDKTAYFLSENATGPDTIVAYDIATKQRKSLLNDGAVDPSRIIYRNGTSVPVGAVFMAGKPRTAFLDDASPEARLQRSLEAAFEGRAVRVTSQTRDGKVALVYVESDRDPGEFYLFDTQAKKASFLLSRASWIDPERMADMKPIVVKARDGLSLNGYLTVPKGGSGKSLPMIVMPHGGPFGIRDTWQYDRDTQLLAAAGYAVLQVNYRGSGGYGRAFMQAGAREWGGKMQDDLTDATRWAIQEGVADRSRICLYGASYGGYAALMGVAKEAELYKCAAGYVGVYDLPTMHVEGDIQQRGSGDTFLREWIGERGELGDVSPNRMASRIKAPVFLAAGGEDERAPIRHSEMMEDALRKAGVPVETLYYRDEGHGFYTPKHRTEFYSRLLAFLSRHLGGQTATAAAAASDAGKAGGSK